MINKLFDAVFVINLDRSPDRLQEIDKRLKKLGIRYERIQAVDGAKLTPEELTKVTTKNCKRFCTRSAIGCAMSHIKVWKEVTKRNLKSVMVLEDDAIFGTDFERRFMQSWKDVPNDWTFVNIGCSSGCGDRHNYTALDWGNTAIVKLSDWIYHVNRKGGTKVSDDLCIPDGPTGAHCYAISNDGAKVLLQELEKVPYMGHIDILINSYGADKLRRYAFTDGSIVSQTLTTESSTVGSGGPPYILNWVADKIEVNKRGVNLGWLMSETGIKIGPFEICAWDGVFALLGILAAALKLPQKSVITLLSGLLLTDHFVFGKLKHLPKTASYWIIFIIAFFVTTKIKK